MRPIPLVAGPLYHDLITTGEHDNQHTFTKENIKMSGPFTGMDIPAVRLLSQQMTAKAGEIRTIMQQLTNQLGNTQWVGPDQQRFTSDWQGQHCTALNNVIQGLEDAAQRANQNAQEQETASS